MTKVHFWCASFALVSGCVGAVAPSQGPGDPSDPSAPQRPPEPVVCSEMEETLPYSDLQRLTKHEYRTALLSLFHATVTREVFSMVELVPDDRVGPDFDTMAQSISSSHVLGYAKVAEAVGMHHQQSENARMRTIRCLDRATDDTCMHNFIRDFGARVYRRPLTEEEQGRYRNLYASGSSESKPLGLRLVLAAMLQAPQFLFRLELGGPDVRETDEEIVLTELEIAQKLSFYLWGVPPDETLLTAAPSLATAEGIEAEFDRMIEDDRAKTRLSRFFSQWLNLDRLPNLMPDPNSDRSARLNDVDSARVSEIVALANYVVWNQQGSFFDLMTTRESFIETGHLADLYEADTWECCGLSQVTLSENRAGVLTRLAILGDTGGIQHPVIRGNRIRKQFLCDELSLPDIDDLGDQMIIDPPADATATTRERFARLTEPAECAGCHSLLNPLGFALSEFDGFGRFRENESIYDDEGRFLTEIPANAVVDPQIEGSGEPVINGAVELGAVLATHPKALDCMAEQWLEYNLARERERTDECAVSDLANAIASDEAGYLEMLRRWVTRPEFRTRRVRRDAEGS